MLTNEKKIEIARKMLGEDKPYNKIAKKSHLSPNRISEINKQLQGESIESKHTQAYRMFDVGKDLREPKLILRVALRLGLTQEQIQRFYNEYLIMIRNDALRELYTRNPEQIQTLLDLAEALSDNNISPLEYLNTLQLVYEIGELRRQKNELQNDITALIAITDQLRSKEMELQKKLSFIDIQVRNEGENLNRLKQQAEEIDIKNSKLEMALNGDAEPFLKHITSERMSYNKEELLELIDFIHKPIFDALRLAPLMTWRLTGQFSLPFDRFIFISELKKLASSYIEDWLKIKALKK